MVELSELDGMKKSDVESVKRFITTLTDRYRPAKADTLSVFTEVLYLLDQRMRHHICMTVLGIEGSGPSVCRHLSGAKEVLSRILESTTFKALHLTCSRAYHRLATLMYDFASSTAMN